MSAVADSGHPGESIPDCRVRSFLEQEQRQPAQAALTSEIAQHAWRFFDGITDKDQCSHRHFGMFAEGVSEHALQLGLAGLTVNPCHQVTQSRGIANPARGPEIFQPAVVAELHGELCDRRGGTEHLALQMAGHVPGWLAACGGIHGKQEAGIALYKATDAALFLQEPRDIAGLSGL